MQISWQSTIIVLDRKVSFPKDRTLANIAKEDEEDGEDAGETNDQRLLCADSPKTPSPDPILSSGGLYSFYTRS